jgi:hypothetical protein
MTRLLAEFLERHRGGDRSVNAALERLLGYRPLASVARGPVGLALSEDGALERDGKPPHGIPDEIL